MLNIVGHRFVDIHNREVILHGINVSGDCKLPYTPNLPSHIPDHFLDGDNVSFVNRPFTIESAPSHFSRLRRWGFNTIRYLFTWEALEHGGPGKYDEDYISYTVEVLKIAKAYQFRILMDPHQDTVGNMLSLGFANITSSGQDSVEDLEHHYGRCMPVVLTRLSFRLPKLLWCKIHIQSPLNFQR
jgi:Cellulase (glycosyl hydrolase family 5)